MLQLLHLKADGSLLAGTGYTLAADRKRTELREYDEHSTIQNGLPQDPVRTTAYAYDGSSRLTQETVTARGGQLKRSLAYGSDKVGNRIQKTEPATGKVTDYLIDTTFPQPQVVEEKTTLGSQTESTHHVWGTALIKQLRGGQGTYYHPDGLGSVKVLTDANGAPIDSYEYTAFGEAIGHTGSSAQPYRFAGEHYDPEVAMQYHRARWYDPATGRFTALDPFSGVPSRPATLHKDAYAGDDPVNQVDPTGRFFAGFASGLSGLATTISIGVRLYAISALRVGSVVLYGANHIAAKVASANIAMAIRNATFGAYQRLQLHLNLLRLNAGQMWEALLKPAMEGLLRATPQVSMNGARADWVWRGRHVIDAKRGQYISASQMQIFARYALKYNGSVTYISLTRPSAAIYKEMSLVASKYGVEISVFWLLP